jgi:uncharacterized protein YecA (UPF0149 family)
MGLYNETVEGVNQGAPGLPPRCAPSADPAANLGPETPLGRWCCGFGEGYEWLTECWPEEMSREVEEFVGAALVTLTYFESRELAAAYLAEIGLGDRTPESMAADMLQLFPEAMRGYAEAARTEMAKTEPEPAPLSEPVPTVGRNDRCPCGSGMKFKKCCGR